MTGSAFTTWRASASPGLRSRFPAGRSPLSGILYSKWGGGRAITSHGMAGKSVVVTGGASGIGYAICELFVKSGADASKRDASGRTASSWAARKSYGTKMRVLAAMAVS